MIKDLIITSLETINAYDVVTGDYRFTLDELQSTNIANAQDTSDITGKGGRLLNSLKRSKSVTVTGNNGLLSGGLLELQTGSTFTENANAPVMWPDYKTITSNASTTSYKAVGTAGAEIVSLYIRNADGTLGDKLTQDSAVGDGKFTYDPSTKALAFKASDYADGTEIVIHYKRAIAASVLTNKSNVFSLKCQLYVDAFAEDRCGVVYRIQFYIPMADFNGNFEIALGDNQTVHAFECKSISTTCGTADGNLWTYTVFGANAPDAA